MNGTCYDIYKGLGVYFIRGTIRASWATLVCSVQNESVGSKLAMKFICPHMSLLRNPWLMRGWPPRDWSPHAGTVLFIWNGIGKEAPSGENAVVWPAQGRHDFCPASRLQSKLLAGSQLLLHTCSQAPHWRVTWQKVPLISSPANEIYCCSG